MLKSLKYPIALFLICIPLFSIATLSSADGNLVKIRHTNGTYELLVNNKPIYIQGVGVGRAVGLHGEKFLQMAKDLGANAVRT